MPFRPALDDSKDAPSLAHEDISEEKGVGFADCRRDLIAPDGKYIFFHSPGRITCESPHRALLLSSASPGKFLSTKTLICLHL